MSQHIPFMNKTMTDFQALAFVNASSAALGLPMDEARARRVAAYLQLASGFAQLIESVEMGPEAEPAELFSPASFPDVEPPTPGVRR